MAADLVVEAGDPLFVKRPEQNQVATAWAEAETVQSLE
jgi:fructosamine-3-kinase